MGGFYRQKLDGIRKLLFKRKEGIDSVKVTFIWETDSKGFTDYLINVGQEIPD